METVDAQLVFLYFTIKETKAQHKGTERRNTMEVAKTRKKEKQKRNKVYETFNFMSNQQDIKNCV